MTLVLDYEINPRVEGKPQGRNRIAAMGRAVVGIKHMIRDDAASGIGQSFGHVLRHEQRPTYGTVCVDRGVILHVMKVHRVTPQERAVLRPADRQHDIPGDGKPLALPET